MNRDRRLLRIGVEVDGAFRVYEDRADNPTWIKASGSKYANPQQNTATVQIANLQRDVVNYLLTETSPFNESRSPKRVFVEAGRESTGYSRLFLGDITRADVSQPPDMVLTLEAKTGQYAKGNVVAFPGAAQESLRAISNRVASLLDLVLRFEADDLQIKSFTFTGSSLELVEKIGQAGGVDAYVNDGELVVKNRNTPLRNVVHTLSPSTGMVGLPTMTEYGCKVMMLYSANVQLGGALAVESQINPAINGAYSIYRLDFDLASREDAFYWTAHCARTGWNNAKRFPT